MKATLRWGRCAGVVVAIALAGFGYSAAAARQGPRPAFTIYLRNYAGVPSGTLAEAERVATAIFRDAGIETRWNEMDMAGDRVKAAVARDQPMTLADIQVNVLPDTAAIPAGLSESVMGVAPGDGPDRTLADVFNGRVSALFWKISSAYLKGDIDRLVSRGQLLGHVIAHEVGHLLLNQQGHSPRGIMRGEWAFADFRDMVSGMLLFTSPQAQFMRVEVVRRDEREPTSVAATGAPSTTR